MKKYKFTLKHKDSLLKKVPKEPGIYKFYEEGELVKIGKASQGLKRRMQEYLKKPGPTQFTNQRIFKHIKKEALKVSFEVNKNPRVKEEGLLRSYKKKYGKLPRLSMRI